MQRTFKRALIAWCLVSIIPNALATVIFDSIDNSQFDINYNINLTGTPAWAGLAQSFSTSPGGAVTLDSLTLWIHLESAAATGESVDVNLLVDSGSDTPGALVADLGTISASSLTTAFSDASLTGLTTSLSPGTRYWIELTDSADNVAWAATNSSAGTGVSGEGPYFIQNTGGHGNPAAFEMTVDVQGSSVPEPSSLPLVTLALAGLGLAARKRA